jgi:hypothetical protein
LLSLLRVARRVQKLLASDFRTEIQARVPLAEAVQGVEQYAANMTGGKVLLVPGKT